MPLPTVYVAFSSRESRSRFVASRFAGYLRGSVLDVGCFEAPLRNLLSAGSYVGIDIAGRPDMKLNLEDAERLPFDDDAFDTVLCIDVLEHLDNLHAVFAELVRVSSKHVIVSLPNCWGSARLRIERGTGDIAHYGLPPQRPPDRHKWFFNLAEARDFLRAKAEELGVEVEDLFATEKPRSPILRTLRRIRYPGGRYQNRYSRTVWAVLRKPPQGAAEHPGAIEQHDAFAKKPPFDVS
jgi:SAM-dependent methyltransferase